MYIGEAIIATCFGIAFASVPFPARIALLRRELTKLINHVARMVLESLLLEHGLRVSRNFPRRSPSRRNRVLILTSFLGHHADEITLELTRIVIALSVFAVGVELPK